MYIYEMTLLSFPVQVVADEIIPKLVQGLKTAMHDPESAAAQLCLINAGNELLQVR